MTRSIQQKVPAMRAFLLACLMLMLIAASSAVVLLGYVQNSSTNAFAEPSARVDQNLPGIAILK